jgi:hypothetical protein
VFFARVDMTISLSRLFRSESALSRVACALAQQLIRRTFLPNANATANATQ